MSSKLSKRYTAHLKFQVVLAVIKGDKTIGQLVCSYHIHPISIIGEKRELMEK